MDAPPKKRLGRPPKSAASAPAPVQPGPTGSFMPVVKRGRGRPPKDPNRAPPDPNTPARLGRPPKALVAIREAEELASKEAERKERERLEEIERRRKPASLAETNLQGLVVLDYPPHPWRWAPGFRRGEIVWTELVHPAVRLHKQSAADVPNGGKILWPAVVVDRWVSNPRDSIDPRLAVVKAATADSEDGEFDAVFHPLPTSNPSESGTLNTAPAVTSTSTTATIDLLDTFARYEVKNALKNVADYHGDDEDSGSMEVDEDASSVMDLNASSTNSVIGADEVPSNNSNGNSTTAKRHVVIPFGLPSNRGGRTSTRASRTASPISSSVSDVVSDFSDVDDVIAAAISSTAATVSSYAAPIKPKNPLPFVAQPTRRGRGRGTFKTLLNSHVRLQDPTGITRSANTTSTFADSLKRKRKPNSGKPKDEDYEEAAASNSDDETSSSAESGDPETGLQIHYLVRPLPLPAGTEALNRDGTHPPTPTDSTLTKGVFYRPAEQVIPFALYNPDCREDVLWNVAAMQALDISGSWGVPVQDATDPEEVGLWGDVLDAMNLPPRGVDSPGGGTGWWSGTLVNNGNPHDTVKRPISMKPGGLDVWGLDKERAVQPLLAHVRQSNWVGNDVDTVPPHLTNGDTFLRRFRLGPERIQVGDIVRLGRNAGRGRGAIRKALVVQRKEDMDRFIAEQSKRFGPRTGSPQRRPLFGEAGDAGPKKSQAFAVVNGTEFVLRVNEEGLAVVEAVTGEGNEDSMDESVGDSGLDPSTVYGISLPSTDGIEYLEVTHIILSRPDPTAEQKSGLMSPVEFPRKSVRPSVQLRGRIFYRIPSDGRAARYVPLWFPTGEVRTVNATAGEVLCRVHSQFPSATLTGVAASGGAGGWSVVTSFGTSTTSYSINVGGVGTGWKGSGGLEETTFSGIRLHRDDILRGQKDV